MIYHKMKDMTKYITYKNVDYRKMKNLTVTIDQSLLNYKKYTSQQHDNKKPEYKFSKLVELLKQAESFKLFANMMYLDMISINNRNAFIKKPSKNFDIRKLFLNASTTNKTIYNQYIDYDINKQASTFGDLFKLKMYSTYQGNLKANSCFVNAIFEHYFDAFKRKYTKELTYDQLCDIIKIDNMEQDIGLTIRDSIKFFEKYSLGLTVIDVYGKITFNYRPSKLRKDIYPAIRRRLRY